MIHAGMKHYRVVSVCPRDPVSGRLVLRWVVQKRAGPEAEAQWENAVFIGVNLFNTADEAVRKMKEQSA